MATSTSLPPLTMESLTAVRNVLGINKHAAPIDSQEISLLWRVVNSITNLLSLTSSGEFEFTAMRARDVLILNLYRLARFRPDQTLLHLTLAERMDAERGIGDLLSDESRRRNSWERKVYDSYHVPKVEDCQFIEKRSVSGGFSASPSARDQRANHHFNLFCYLSEPALQKLEHLYHLRIGTLPHSLELEAPYLTAFNPTAGPAPDISALRANYIAPLEALILSDALTEPFSSHTSDVFIVLKGCLRDLQRITSYVRISNLINGFLTPMNTLASLDLSTTQPAEAVLAAFYTFGLGVLQDSKLREYLKDDAADKGKTYLETLYLNFPFRAVRDLALTSLDLYQRNDTKDSFFNHISNMINELSASRPLMREIIVQETMCFLEIKEEVVVQKPDKAAKDTLKSVAKEGLSRVIFSNLVETITPRFVRALRDKPIPEWTDIQRRGLLRAFWILGEGYHHLSEAHHQRVATTQLWLSLRKFRNLIKGKKERVLSFFNKPQQNESTMCALLNVLDYLTQHFSVPQESTSEDPRMATDMKTLAEFLENMSKRENDDLVKTKAVVNDDLVKNKVQRWMQEVPTTHNLSKELTNLKQIDPANLTENDHTMIKQSRFLSANAKKLFHNLQHEATADLKQQASEILSNLNFQTEMEKQIRKLLVNKEFCSLLEHIEMHEQIGAFDEADKKEKTLQKNVGDRLKLFFPDVVDSWISDIRECNGFPPQIMWRDKQLQRAIFKIQRLSTKLDELKQFMISGKTIPMTGPVENIAIEDFMSTISLLNDLTQLDRDKNACLIQSSIPGMQSGCLRSILSQEDACMFLAVEDFLEDIRHFTDGISTAVETFGLQEPALAWFIQSQQEAFNTIGNYIAHLGNIVDFDTATKMVRIDRIIRFYCSVFEDRQCGHSLLSALSQLSKCLESELGKPSPKILISFSTTKGKTFIEDGGGRHFTICSDFPHDADNGFSALGLTRAKAVKLLIELNAGDWRRACMFPDIKQALLGDYLPLPLKSERTRDLARQYHRLKAQLKEADKHFKGVDLRQRIKDLKDKELILLNDIYRFVKEENTYIQFVLNTCGYGWLTYPNTKGLLMLLGMMNNVNVHVWQQTGDNEVTLVTHVEDMYLSTTKITALHLLHGGGGMRFERLVEGPVPQMVVVPDPQNFMWFQIDMERSGEIVPSCHSPLQLRLVKKPPSENVLVQQGDLIIAEITVTSDDPERDSSGQITTQIEMKSSSRDHFIRFANSIVFVIPNESQPPSASGYVDPGQLHAIAPDGNCMFDSVREGAMRLRRSQLTVQELRSAVADYINDHFAEYNDHLIYQIANLVRDGDIEGLVGPMREIIVGLIKQYVRTTLECGRSVADNTLLHRIQQDNVIGQYVEMIRQNNAWGGNVELLILSHIAGVQIVVHRPSDRCSDPVIDKTEDPAAPIVHLAYDGAYYNLYLTDHDQQN